MNSNKTTDIMDVLTTAIYLPYNQENIILKKSNNKFFSHNKVPVNNDSENFYSWLMKKRNHTKYIKSPLRNYTIVFTYQDEKK